MKPSIAEQLLVEMCRRRFRRRRGSTPVVGFHTPKERAAVVAIRTPWSPRVGPSLVGDELDQVTHGEVHVDEVQAPAGPEDAPDRRPADVVAATDRCREVP